MHWLCAAVRLPSECPRASLWRRSRSSLLSSETTLEASSRPHDAPPASWRLAAVKWATAQAEASAARAAHASVGRQSRTVGRA